MAEMADPVASLWEDVGEARLREMVAAFYRRVPGDDILGPMYPPEDMAGAEERLFLFLMFRFGGPVDYLEQRGHPRLRMRHMPFAIDAAAGQRWLSLMDAAMEETGIPEEPRSRMSAFFTTVASAMQNR